MKRAPLILAAIWILLNAVGFGYAFASGMEIADMPIGGDLVVYQTGASALINHEPVYDLTPGVMDTNLTYRYHPTFLLPIVALMQLPFVLQVVLWWSVIVVAYIAGVWLWLRLLKEMQFTFWHYLPIFIYVAYDWIGNLSYGNIGPALVFLSAALMWAVYHKRLIPAILLASVIMVIKPQWCFPLLYTLARREDRWFIQSVVGSVVGYIGMTAIFIISTGIERGISIVSQYFEFVLTLQSRYPWKGTDVMFDTFQNSLYQTFLRYGTSHDIANIGTLILQILLLGLLVVMIWRVRQSDNPQQALFVTLSGYVVGMCLLPQLEEGLLAGILAAALWSSYKPTRLYLAYALFEFPMMIGFFTGIHWLVFGMVIPANLIILSVMLAGCAYQVFNPNAVAVTIPNKTEQQPQAL